jgi:uncharacterized Ntn-hydrolase superfamily protein
MLNQLEAGQDAESAIVSAIESDRFAEYRQLTAIDSKGRTGVYSGARVLGLWNTSQGVDCVAGGNLLATPEITNAMVTTFENTIGSLGERLLSCLRAARNLGGEVGPLRSAGLLVVHEHSWPYIDLRIDWDDDARPIESLTRAWEIYSPQADQYVLRAINPTEAPSFEVPGAL